MKRVEVDGGKYTVLLPDQEDERFEALRVGLPWRDLTGDKLVLALASELAERDEAQRRAEAAEAKCERLRSLLNEALGYVSWTEEYPKAKQLADKIRTALAADQPQQGECPPVSRNKPSEM